MFQNKLGYVEFLDMTSNIIFKLPYMKILQMSARVDA